MGYIKEPYGIDFIVDATPPTVEDRKMISDVIAFYKATGRKKTFNKTTKRSKNNKKASVGM